MYTVKFFEKIADLTPRFNAHCGVFAEFEISAKSKTNSKTVDLSLMSTGGIGC